VIELAGVTVRYDETCALAGVSERIPAGHWLGVIGPNGAGKTTLLRSVAGLVEHEGQVLLDGRPTNRLTRRALARLVAFVPQQPELPPDMTVAEYVLLGRTPHIGHFRMETRTDLAVCAALLDRLDLAGFRKRHLLTLSGGELQRLVLARALAQEAPVLLLDEPTSALDLGRRVEALELVDELRRERELTVLSAVHDLTLAGQFADRLLLLDGGRVVATGPPSDVLREDLLARHYGAGVCVLRTPTGEIVVVSRRNRAVAPAGLPGHGRADSVLRPRGHFDALAPEQRGGHPDAGADPAGK
jgi:iron complex transport system ATP-binding protein